MTPLAMHSPRWAMGCTGPALPDGGTTAGSTSGGVIAPADGPLTASTVSVTPAMAPARRITESMAVARKPRSRRIGSE